MVGGCWLGRVWSAFVVKLWEGSVPHVTTLQSLAINKCSTINKSGDCIASKVLVLSSAFGHFYLLLWLCSLHVMAICSCGCSRMYLLLLISVIEQARHLLKSLPRNSQTPQTHHQQYQHSSRQHDHVNELELRVLPVNVQFPTPKWDWQWPITWYQHQS